MVTTRRRVAEAVRLLRLAVAGVGLAGCGPVLSSTALGEAHSALHAAESAGAEQYALYEYVSASEYLDKAREELGYSDFRAARAYARRALEFAEAAAVRAGQSPERLAPGTELPE